MATATRGKPHRQPMSDAGRRGLRAVGKRAKKQAQKKWQRTTRNHPTVGLVAYLLMGLASVLMLVVGLTAETLLFRLLGFLVAALGGLGTMAVRQAHKMEKAAQEAPRVRPQGPAPRTPSPPSSSAAPPPPTGGVVKCTKTGKPAKDCDCATRHITSTDGAEHFRRPLGTPYGWKKAGDA